ncbi:MAG: hypothetical protein M9938_05915 [Solirubrobacterales bacterium]|nr:hypothetical protein [Solirubrobacterales bacterium]
MAQALLFAVIASSALVIGAGIGLRWSLPATVTAWLMGFASGALITAVAFELFLVAYEHGGIWRAGLAFFAGATAFIVVDSWLARRNRARHARGSAVGLGLLAAVTLDGIPENLALGVGLIEQAAPALLVAIFVSNLPEAIVGARKMKEAGMSDRFTGAIWIAAAILLAAAVIAGYVLLEGVPPRNLSWPLGFAAGAVLASLADTLMPEAYSEGGPCVAYATALGFLLSFMLAAVSH